jgi:hypothetical protein
MDILKSAYMKEFYKVAGIYLLWISIHYCSSHMYTYWCTSSTIVGFILSPFVATAPHCQALRWGISHGADQIVVMWTTLGTWFMMNWAFTPS